MKKIIFTAILLFLGTNGFTQTWNQVSVPTSENLLDVEFPEDAFGVGYIGGENGTLLKTVDGGTNWTVVNYTGINASSNFHFMDLEFVNAAVGFATLAGTQGIYKTVDGGQSWIELDDFSIGAFCYRSTLHVISEHHFFVSGAGCFQSAMIVEYLNGVWSEKTDHLEEFNASQYVRDMEFRGSLGIATVNSNMFLRSIDGGQTWDTIPSPIISPMDNLTDLIIVNDTLVYAGHELYSGHYIFFQSNDAGLTWWEMQPDGGDMIFYASWFAFEQSANGDLYASASQVDNYHFMHENNNGFWSYEQVDQKIVSMDSYGNDIVYAVGDSGYVIVNSGSSLFLDEIELNANVYPNPSTDVLHIALEKGADAYVRISDLSGSVIEERAFNSKLEMPVLNWPPGIYLINITSSGSQKTLRHVHH